MLEQLKSAIEQVKINSGMPVKLVAIDGFGGSGKTHLAKLLSHELQATIVQTDDFASMDNPLGWWPDFVKEILEPIQSGAKSLSYERSSWWHNHHPQPIVNQPVTSIMIIEGVSSSRSEFRPYLSYSIWVETPKSVYQKRGIARDLADNPDSKTPDELKEIWEKWHQYEQDYFKLHNPKKHADVVVDGTE